MRVYFVEARTTVGWKGADFNDPHLMHSLTTQHLVLRLAVALLLHLAETWSAGGHSNSLIPVVAPITSPDSDQLAAIRCARTNRSQNPRRRWPRDCPMPIGFKNGTDGSVLTADQPAMEAAARPDHFLGISQPGHAAHRFHHGNPDGHLGVARRQRRQQLSR